MGGRRGRGPSGNAASRQGREGLRPEPRCCGKPGEGIRDGDATLQQRGCAAAVVHPQYRVVFIEEDGRRKIDDVHLIDPKGYRTTGREVGLKRASGTLTEERVPTTAERHASATRLPFHQSRRSTGFPIAAAASADRPRMIPAFDPNHPARRAVPLWGPPVPDDAGIAAANRCHPARTARSNFSTELTAVSSAAGRGSRLIGAPWISCFGLGGAEDCIAVDHPIRDDECRSRHAFGSPRASRRSTPTRSQVGDRSGRAAARYAVL